MSRTGWLFAIAAAAVVAIVLIPLFRSGNTNPAGPAGFAGQPAPVFALNDAAGAPASLSNYRGNVVVLNLWASWCPPCRAEMPDLSRLSHMYGKDGVVVIGVNQGESPQRASSFARSLRIEYPIWIDEEQRYGRVFTALGLPTTVFIDRRGVVAKGVDGALTFDQMRDEVATLVKNS